MPEQQEQTAAQKRDEAKRRRALLERYQNTCVGLVLACPSLALARRRLPKPRTGAQLTTVADRRSGTCGRARKGAHAVKTVHGRLPTKAEAAREKAAEQRSKIRYRDGEIVTRKGEKYHIVRDKAAEEEEAALLQATSVNLAFKSSKGRRHKGR